MRTIILTVATAVSVGVLKASDFTVPEAEFAKYHRAITGRAPAAGTVRFAVDPGVSREGHDAYTIKSDAQGVVLTGSNARSVLYAVYDLLERRGGCRWFWDGDVVPKKEAIDLSGLDVKEESQFEYRAIRYFAHRGLTRFQAEHWGLEDWKKEIDWCLKRRLNCIMPRIGMDDTWQKAYPDIVPYPDPAKPLPEAGKGYDNRSLFWSLRYRGELRKAFTAYAFERGLMIPTDFGTMTHWYSRTPQAFLDHEKPPFLPQATTSYGLPTARVFDIREQKWLDSYWHLTEAFVDADYGTCDLLHTIGLGERMVYKDRARNRDFKIDVLNRLIDLAGRKAPDTPVLLAGWDFYFKWTPEEVRALLPHLDPKRVLIWDYEADAVRNWNANLQRLNSNFTDWGVVGRFPYTFGIFLAYEQSLDIRANYPLIEERQKAIENDPFCKGYMFWPESSHTDTFALRYFTANAWRTGGKTADALLPAFCRDRYGAQAARFESIWRKTIPVSYMNEYWGNYASNLLALYEKLPSDNYNTYPMTKMIERFRAAEGVFAELTALDWSDAFAVRDAIDLARTLVDRKIEMERQRMLQAYEHWKKKIASAEIVRDRTDRFLLSVRAMTKILALHTDYSLWESYERLDRIEKIVNPEFDHVLVDNAANGYCRSHQYEVAANWYEPFAEFLAAEVIRHVDADDRTDLDHDKLVAESDRLHDALLKRPLAEMRPTLPRTPENFKPVMIAMDGPVEGTPLK